MTKPDIECWWIDEAGIVPYTGQGPEREFWIFICWEEQKLLIAGGVSKAINNHNDLHDGAGNALENTPKQKPDAAGYCRYNIVLSWESYKHNVETPPRLQQKLGGMLGIKKTQDFIS